MIVWKMSRKIILTNGKISKDLEMEKKKSENTYDPIKMMKSRLAGEEISQPITEPNQDNVGKAENGLVVFDSNEDDNSELLAVKKIYHSSSEDEKSPTKEANIKSVQKSIKKSKKSFGDKQEMTQRFLEKQKEKSLTLLKTEEDTRKKYYSDSSDSEDEQEPVATNASGKEVLTDLKSFSSFWKDSDNEEESNETKETLTHDDDKEVSTAIKFGDKAKQRVEFEDASIFRYDPTKEEQDKFIRKPDEVEEPNESTDKPKSYFHIREDLKSAFGAKSSSSSFSFGFKRNTEDTPETDSKRSFSFGFSEKVEEKLETSNENFKEVVIKDDTATKFGLALKGKGSSKNLPSFFFTEEDPRLEAGLSFFFDKQSNLDDLRSKFNEQRPILSEILKKRARSKAKRKDNSSGPLKKKNHSWRKGNDSKKFRKSVK